MSSFNQQVFDKLEIKNCNNINCGFIEGFHEYVVHVFFYKSDAIRYFDKNDLIHFLEKKAYDTPVLNTGEHMTVYKITSTEPIELEEIDYNYSVELVE